MIGLPAALAIAGMAAVTYLCRAGGYWLFRRIKPGPKLRIMLGYIPGTLFVSYVVPALLAGGWPSWAGAVAAVGLTLWRGDLGVAVIVSTALAWSVWAIL